MKIYNLEHIVNIKVIEWVILSGVMASGNGLIWHLCVRRCGLWNAALALAGCGTTTSERATSGAGVGAAVGAGAAAVTGGSVTQGAVIGGGVGAATGAATDEDDINLD